MNHESPRIIRRKPVERKARAAIAALQPSATQPDVDRIADVIQAACFEMVDGNGIDRGDAEIYARAVLAAMPNHIADTSKMVEVRRNALMEAIAVVNDRRCGEIQDRDDAVHELALNEVETAIRKLAEAPTTGEKDEV